MRVVPFGMPPTGMDTNTFNTGTTALVRVKGVVSIETPQSMMGYTLLPMEIEK